MPKSKIMWIGDVHLCDHPPGRRAEGYKEQIFAKLYECVEIAKKEGVTHVVFAGDIYHLKSASRVSHKLVQETADLMLAFGVPVIILVGNHDITDGRLDTLEKQPLGTLKYISNVTLLGWDELQVDEDVHLHPVPGVSNVEIDVFAKKKIGKRDITIVHQSIVPDIEREIEQARAEMFDAQEVAEICETSIVLYGHQHRNDGVYKRTRKDGTEVTFVNLGAICRLTIGEEDVTKEPRVLTLEFRDDENRTVVPKIHKLGSVVPAGEAYYLEDHMEEKNKHAEIDETLRMLKNAEVSAFSIESVIKEVETRADVEEPVKKEALDLLEEVR